MGFNLTTNTSPSTLTAVLDDTTVSTTVTDIFFSVNEAVDEYLSTTVSFEASLDIIKLDPPWPEIQVQLSKTYERYK